MHLKSALVRLSFFAMATFIRVALATFIAPSILNAQAADCPPVGNPDAFLCSLSADAQRAADPAGDLNYATKLIQMIAPHVSQGNVTQLAQRLASADQAARHNPGKYIPETAIAASFNRLMAQVIDKSAPPIRTDAQTVHKLRGMLAAKAPALFSIKEHPSSCLPDEAVFLIFELTFNNGRVVSAHPGQSLLSAENAMLAEDAANDASLKLDQYLAAHWTWTNMALLKRLLSDMGI
jgi:hypothetical protein